MQFSKYYVKKKILTINSFFPIFTQRTGKYFKQNRVKDTESYKFKFHLRMLSRDWATPGASANFAIKIPGTYQNENILLLVLALETVSKKAHGKMF